MKDDIRNALPVTFKGRSLGESVRFATSDISAFQKSSDLEAKAVISNSTRSIIMKDQRKVSLGSNEQGST